MSEENSKQSGKKETTKTKQKPLLNKRTLVIIFIAALLLINALIFSGIFDKPSQLRYKDVIIEGELNVQQEMTTALNHPKVVLIMEGDTEETQKNLALTNALVGLVNAFQGREVEIIGIEFTDGQAVNCPDHELSECLNRIPQENEVIIKLKYPSYKENKITVHGQVIEIQGKTSLDTMAMAQVFEKAFLVKK